MPRASNPPAYGDVEKDYKRRVVEVVQLECTSLGVKGKHDYPTQANYLEVFITESMQGPPNADMYGEVIRSLSPTNTPQSSTRCCSNSRVWPARTGLRRRNRPKRGLP